MTRHIFGIIIVLIISSLSLSCNEKANDNPEKPIKKATVEMQENKKEPMFENVEITKKATKRIELYKPEVIRRIPHDTQAFTQGLTIYNGFILESTGQRGQSSIRKVDWITGNIIKKTDIEAKYFGEGITVFNEKLYFLTWTSQICLVFDPETFEQTGSFTYYNQGWGLTNDDTYLIMSDGSSYIRFIDPETFSIVRTLFVKLNGKPVENLNELEYINGKIFANIWGEDYLYIIDPDSGDVEGKLDLSELRSIGALNPKSEVLNGIAYNPTYKTYLVTGKNWDYYFEIKLNKMP